MNWLDLAACTLHPNIDWFSYEGHEQNRARAVCLNECTVGFECVRDGEYDVEGVRGGLKPSERKKLRRRLDNRQAYNAAADKVRAKLGPLMLLVDQ